MTTGFNLSVGKKGFSLATDTVCQSLLIFVHSFPTILTVDTSISVNKKKTLLKTTILNEFLI